MLLIPCAQTLSAQNYALRRELSALREQLVRASLTTAAGLWDLVALECCEAAGIHVGSGGDTAGAVFPAASLTGRGYAMSTVLEEVCVSCYHLTKGRDFGTPVILTCCTPHVMELWGY
jgi:hypothetical protein